MAVSCGLIKSAKNLEELKSLENQIMDWHPEFWICAYKRRLELGATVSFIDLEKFPKEFSKLVSLLLAEKKKIQKEHLLKLEKKLTDRTITFEDIYLAVIEDKRFGVPEEVFLKSFITMFEQIEDYSNIVYKPIWKLFEYFHLDFDKKYSDFKYIRHFRRAKDKYVFLVRKWMEDQHSFKSID